MINKENIVAFISFLYEKKYNQAAPDDLLESWENIDDDETNIHLQGLYNHWGLDKTTSDNYESEFLNTKTKKNFSKPIMPSLPEEPSSSINRQQTNSSSQNSYTPPTNNNAEYYAYKTNTSNKKWLFALIGILILGGAGYYIWNLSQKENAAPKDVVATNSINKDIKESKPQVKPIEPAAPEQTEQDAQNARTINDLLQAESSRDFDAIYQYFDTNMQRYWDINYPTYSELYERYTHIWGITEDQEHTNVRVNKISNNTYDVLSSYSYYSLKEEKQKHLNTKTRYVFNNEGKIVQTYGLK